MTVRHPQFPQFPGAGSGACFLDDAETATLAQLHQRAQELATHARLARIGLDSFIRQAAARRGLDPAAEYRVTPRGELLPAPLTEDNVCHGTRAPGGKSP